MSGSVYIGLAEDGRYKVGSGWSAAKRCRFHHVKLVWSQERAYGDHLRVEMWAHRLLRDRGIPDGPPEWYWTDLQTCIDAVEEGMKRAALGQPSQVMRRQRKAAVNDGVGAPAKPLTDKEQAAVDLHWRSAKHATDKAASDAIRAMGFKRLTASVLIKRAGKSGRPYTPKTKRRKK